MRALMLVLWAVTLAVVCEGTLLSSVTQITPIDSVINLLVGLNNSVTAAGAAEHTTYDAFAQFCRDKTTTRSSSITSTHNTIQTQSSLLIAKTKEMEQKEQELSDKQAELDAATKERDDLIAEHMKATAKHDAKIADFDEALRNLGNAITSMQNSIVFLQTRENVLHDSKLADMMRLLDANERKPFESLLQTTSSVNPGNAVYNYHSHGIISTMQGLQTIFTNKKNEENAEWTKVVNLYNNQLSTLNTKINSLITETNNLKNIVIPGLRSDIAAARTQIVNSQASLTDDQTYLNDLTAMCEARAKDWDQRATMRSDELNAIAQALDIMQNGIPDRTNQQNAAVYARAMLLESGHTGKTADVSPHVVGTMLLQEVAVESNLQQVAIKSHAEAMTHAKQKAASYLRTQGKRMQSTLLSSVALKIANSPFVDENNPFVQVKKLVQELIERLIKESAAEATKKGFCDETLGKAETDRQFRWEQTQDLSQDVHSLELKEDELVNTIALLTNDLTTLNQDLNTTRINRASEKQDNQYTIRTAGDGLTQVNQAIDILKVFYRKAARATVFSQISPVEEDTTGPGFNGAYQGEQTSSKAVIGLLEVISSDFDRTVRQTTEAEAKAHADFIKFERATLASISGKEKSKEISIEDLKTTRDTIQSKMQELQRAQTLLDDALKIIEAHKAMCIDTGMLYADRTQLRAEEVQALNEALCILDVNNVETACPPPGR